MIHPPAWDIEIRVRCASRAEADRVYRTLRPEADREVPRTRTSLQRGRGCSLRLHLHAQDTGAARAAVNTHLGWLALVRATERVARAGIVASGRQ